MFVARSYGKIIISEGMKDYIILVILFIVSLPVFSKTIKPVGLGGVAGGQSKTSFYE